jgi:hypothetical protein
MTTGPRFRFLLLAMAAILLALPSAAQPAHSPEFESARRKFAWIAENGERAEPSTKPTVVTAEEWNAYLNEGGVKLPAGLSHLHISSEPGMAHAQARVDFDRLTANRTRGNPLLFLFTGTHQVAITARAEGADGMGTVHVESVAFDGLEIPRIALEYFANHFLRPKYGNAVALDSSFRLPDRIDTAVVGADQLSITQR